MSSTFLDPTEVAELTHRTRCDAQVRALRFMGIEYRIRPDNSVAILRSHIDRIFGGDTRKSAEPEIEPDWGAIHASFTDGE